MSAQTERRGRVLIVDDQVEILEGMKALLEIEGMDVTTHQSMITLPLILRQAAPDVILLDLSVGALSGQSFFQLGRERLLRNADASVLLFSGRPARELEAMAEEFGADGFVAKSQDAMEIVARVRTSIEQHRALRAAGVRKESNVVSRTASASAH
jgi:DNA-binding response OmpR family regulator